MSESTIRERIQSLYEGRGTKVRLYVRARLLLLPIEEVVAELAPVRGSVLSLGCGYGLLEAGIALLRPDLSVVGSDIDAGRIRVAQQALNGLPNLLLRVQDARALSESGPFNAVVLVDLLHHLARQDQEVLLDRCSRLLTPGGRIILKEMGNVPRWKYLWNYLHDVVMTRGGPLGYRSLDEWRSSLASRGLEVTGERLTLSQPYPHIMVRGVRHAG